MKQHSSLSPWPWFINDVFLLMYQTQSQIDLNGIILYYITFNSPNSKCSDHIPKWVVVSPMSDCVCVKWFSWWCRFLCLHACVFFSVLSCCVYLGIFVFCVCMVLWWRFCIVSVYLHPSLFSLLRQTHVCLFPPPLSLPLSVILFVCLSLFSRPVAMLSAMTTAS